MLNFAAVSRLCISPTTTPCFMSIVFLVGTPSSSYLKEPKAPGMVPSSKMLTWSEAIFLPSLSMSTEPDNVRSASAKCPKAS